MARIIRRTLYYLLGIIIGLMPFVILSILFAAFSPTTPPFLSTLSWHFDTIMLGIALLTIMVLVLQPRGHWSHPVAWGVISAAIIVVCVLYVLTTAIPF